MSSLEFQRARQPEQKRQRRATILRVARQMLDEGPVDELTLSALARRVGLAKSNVYRYFESREAILLEVVGADFDDWVGELSTRLPRLRSKRRVDKVAQLMASTYAARPRMCQLMSILPSVIEHNVTAETILRVRNQMLEQSDRLAEAMHRVISELPVEAHIDVIRFSYGLLVGLWPIAHPSPAMEHLYDDPRFASYRWSFETDLARGVRLMLEGMLREVEGDAP